MNHRKENLVQTYADALKEQTQSRPAPAYLPQIDNNAWQDYFKQQYLIEQTELEEYFNSGDSGSSLELNTPEFVFVDPLPIISIMFPVGLFDFTSIFFDDLSL